MAVVRADTAKGSAQTAGGILHCDLVLAWNSPLALISVNQIALFKTADRSLNSRITPSSQALKFLYRYRSGRLTRVSLQSKLKKVLVGLVDFEMTNEKYGDFLQDFTRTASEIRSKRSKQIEGYIEREIERQEDWEEHQTEERDET